MTLPRSRRISVDGTNYRWMLPAKEPRPARWAEEDKTNSALLTVQKEGGRGRPAQAFLHWSNDAPVTPEVVAIVVRTMIASGWNPSERGSAFPHGPIAVDELPTRAKVARDVMSS